MAKPRMIKTFVTIGDVHCSIESDVAGNNGQVTIHGGAITQDEMAMLGIISSMMRTIMSGNPLCFVFKPEQEVDIHRLVTCEWLGNGVLRIKEGKPHRKYQHAETQEQAVSREKSFTCPYSLALVLPKKRPSKQPPQPVRKDSSVPASSAAGSGAPGTGPTKNSV